MTSVAAKFADATSSSGFDSSNRNSQLPFRQAATARIIKLMSNSLNKQNRLRFYHIQSLHARRNALPPRMALPVQLREPRGVDMRVDLGRADVRMPEKLLNGPDVGAMLEHVRREAVPQHVRGDARVVDADCGGSGFDDLEDSLTRERLLEARDEDVRDREVALGEDISGGRQIGVDRPSRRLADRHDAFLRALAEHAQQFAV